MLKWVNDKLNSLQPDFETIGRQTSTDGYFPKVADLVIPSIALATLFIILREVLDRFVVTPFGAYFGITEETTQQLVTPNPILEAVYKKHKNPSDDTILSLTKKSQLSERQVQIWFRKRKKQEKASDLKRLQDASWQLVFYLIMSWYGIYVLWDEPWFTNSEHIWPGYPTKHTVSDGLYWYILIEFSFYISSIVTLFTDHKRKDFTEMVTHHILTILLILLSWSYNGVRIGALVICVHDPVDYIMAFAKICNYIKYKICCEAAFILFFIVWIGTRLIIFPYMMLYSAVIDRPEYGRNSGSNVQFYTDSLVMQILTAMLIGLQILHLFWTFMIIRTAATKFTGGKLQDARSDSEDSVNEDNQKENEHGNSMSNSSKKTRTKRID